MSDPPDPNPFSSTEQYYADHRPDYGEVTVDYLCERFELDEDARVLDVGCGAGQLAIPLARHARVVAMDPNEEMLRHARRRAAVAGVDTVEWVLGSDADLHETMGPFRLTTMGRSFHWMDQERTLDRLYRATEPGGGVALLTDHEWLTKGREKWQQVVYDVVDDYLDDLPERVDPSTVSYDDPWDEKLATFGFESVESVTFDQTREWTVDGIVGYILSLSFCSPETFGEERDAFERDLRTRLGAFGRDSFRETTAIEVVSGRR